MLKTLLDIFKKKEINISEKIQSIQKIYPIKKIFYCINNYSENSEVRYVGGCIRKSIINEKIDDVDLATNLNPSELEQCLFKNNIKYINTGKKFGTLTLLVENHKFEITSLRKDVDTDGRHTKVKYTKNWREDSERRDFTFNSIYSNLNGELFDPYNGKKDLIKGEVNFIGNTVERIKEDYLRILRYVRFFLNYSKTKHKPEVISAIKQNIVGIHKLSKERLLDELKKIILSDGFLRINDDELSKEIIKLIFPQIKNFTVLKDNNKKSLEDLIKKKDFIFIISLLIIDFTDNTDFFLHKYNFSNNDKKRIIFLKEIFNKQNEKSFLEKRNLKKILYRHGRERVLDILRFQLFYSKNKEKIVNMLSFFNKEGIPTFPIKAGLLIKNYNFKQDKILGSKLKDLENYWINNDFQITKKEISKIVKN
mgnify:CR=1 FL=1|tara:strand:- start:5992 stop:7260 length:1269 start_codon:yes stop_codon:yes gene_type:complete